MRLDITGRNVTITPALRQLIDKRLAKLERVLNAAAVSVTVILTKEKFRHRAELVVHARGDHTMSGNGEGNSWPLSLRQAAEKVERQAGKLKSRWTEGKRQRTSAKADGAATPPAAAPKRPHIRPTRYAIKPMSIEDAAMRVESGPEMFVVFRNAETDAISIVHRRKDGTLGLIEPD
jgi:putative sigma-54 modulation protein